MTPWWLSSCWAVLYTSSHVGSASQRPHEVGAVLTVIIPRPTPSSPGEVRSQLLDTFPAGHTGAQVPPGVRRSHVASRWRVQDGNRGRLEAPLCNLSSKGAPAGAGAYLGSAAGLCTAGVLIGGSVRNGRPYFFMPHGQGILTILEEEQTVRAPSHPGRQVLVLQVHGLFSAAHCACQGRHSADVRQDRSGIRSPHD